MQKCVLRVFKSMACNLSALIRHLRCCAVVLPENPFTHPSVTRSAYPSSKGTTITDVMGSDGGVHTRGSWEDNSQPFPSAERLCSTSFTALCSMDYVPHLAFVCFAAVLVLVSCTS